VDLTFFFSLFSEVISRHFFPLLSFSITVPAIHISLFIYFLVYYCENPKPFN
jgi:hypothetical protein